MFSMLNRGLKNRINLLLEYAESGALDHIERIVEEGKIDKIIGDRVYRIALARKILDEVVSNQLVTLKSNIDQIKTACDQISTAAQQVSQATQEVAKGA